MKILVITPMYSFHEMTKKCIELAEANSGVPMDILIVDDGSPKPFIDCYDPIQGVEVLRLRENSGFTNAVNQGIIWANNRYDYLCILSNDTEPLPDFLKRLVDVMDSDDSIAVTGSSRIHDGKDRRYIEHWGADLVRGHTWTTTENLTEPTEVIWIPFACVLLRSKHVRYLGLLDRRMRNYSSDNDYCMRAIQAGFKVVLVPQSLVYHHHEVTTKHLGIAGHEDNSFFLEKLSGLKNQEILDKLPLDAESKTYGKINFIAYKKGGL